MKKIFVITSIFFSGFELVHALENPWTYVQQQRAANAFKRGDFKSAEDIWQNLILYNPHDLSLLYNLGKAAYAKQDYALAENYFTKVADAKSDHYLESLFDQGNARVKQQALEKALESYEAVVALDKDHTQAQAMIDQIKKILEQQKNQKPKKEPENKKSDKDNKKDSSDDKNSSQEKKKDDTSSDTNESKDDASNESSDTNKEDAEKKLNKSDPKDRSSDRESKDAHKGDEQKKHKNKENDSLPENAPSDDTREKKDGENNQAENSDNQKKDNAAQAATSGTKKEAACSNKEASEDKNNKYTDQEMYLLKQLDVHDAKAFRAMLKYDLQKGMQERYGQKNW